MIEMKMENERTEALAAQRLGENWIRAITDGAPDRIQSFSDPEVVSLILTPKRYLTLESSGALVARYHTWFDSCADFQLVASRVSWIGERLGIFYSLLLRDAGDWYRIEQQLYCTLSDGRVTKLHLLCSGFELVGAGESTTSPAGSGAGGQDPAHDVVLEFHTEQPGGGSTCAVLTPMIRSKLREMQSGQVLEVRVDDPSARADIEAWSRLSGNRLVKIIAAGGQPLRFFVEKK